MARTKPRAAKPQSAKREAPSGHRTSEGESPPPGVPPAVWTVVNTFVQTASDAELKELARSEVAHMQIVRYLEVQDLQWQGVGVMVETMHQERGGMGVDGIPITTWVKQQTYVGLTEWMPGMGSWPAHYWANFAGIMARLSTCGANLSSIMMQYKLQDNPQPDFASNVMVEFRKLCTPGALFDGLECFLHTTPVDASHDLALLFDQELAPLLPFPLEDRRHCPGLTFHVGEGPTMMVKDYTGRVFRSQRQYFDERIRSVPALAGSVADKLWSVLQASPIPVQGLHASNLHSAMKEHADRLAAKMQETIPCVVQEVAAASKEGPAVANNDTRRSCCASGCTRKEGDPLEDAVGVLKLRKCPCRAVRYCSKECQRRDWRGHKATCSWKGDAAA